MDSKSNKSMGNPGGGKSDVTAGVKHGLSEVSSFHGQDLGKLQGQKCGQGERPVSVPVKVGKFTIK